MKPSAARFGKALWAEVRAMFGLGIVVASYFLLGFVFAASAQGEGLVSPTGVRIGIALLGGVVLLLRIAVLFVIPAIAIYRLVTRLLDRDRAPEKRSDPAPFS